MNNTIEGFNIEYTVWCFEINQLKAQNNESNVQNHVLNIKNDVFNIQTTLFNIQNAILNVKLHLFYIPRLANNSTLCII